MQGIPDDNLWWIIDGSLAGMGMPYIAVERRLEIGGPLRKFDDDLPKLYDTGIRTVVSLLNIESDRQIYGEAGFEFHNWSIRNGHAPNLDQADAFVSAVDRSLAAKRPAAVFCEAGLGRTGTMLACYLIHCGRNAVQAIADVRKREPAAIETPLQIEFIALYSKLKLSA